jgi:hypothetical protein
MSETSELHCKSRIKVQHKLSEFGYFNLYPFTNSGSSVLFKFLSFEAFLAKDWLRSDTQAALTGCTGGRCPSCVPPCGVHPAIADAILGHGDKNKALQSLYLTISDDDLIRAIDMMRFDVGDTEIWVKK